MTESILPAPIVSESPLTPTKFQREQTAFRRLLPSLLNDYRNKYVAIHEEHVVGSGDNVIDVANAAYAKFGYQPIYVDLVTDQLIVPVRIPYRKTISAS